MPRHEYAVRVGLVISERAAVVEPELLIQLPGGQQELVWAGLETEPGEPMRLASIMMCLSSMAAMPSPLRAGAVRIDFTSAWLASSLLIAPQPTMADPSMTDQNVISGLRRSSRSRACLLSGEGVMDRISWTCSPRNWAICGPDRSSTTICTVGGLSWRCHAVSWFSGRLGLGLIIRSFGELAPVKVAPAPTRTARWGALTARQRPCADSMSLNAVAQEVRPRLGGLPVPVSQGDQLLAAVGAPRSSPAGPDGRRRLCCPQEDCGRASGSCIRMTWFSGRQCW